MWGSDFRAASPPETEVGAGGSRVMDGTMDKALGPGLGWLPHRDGGPPDKGWNYGQEDQCQPNSKVFKVTVRKGEASHTRT